MTLNRIDGLEGAYRPFEEILCEQISKMVSRFICTCVFILNIADINSACLRLTAKLQLGFLVTVPSFRGVQVSHSYPTLFWCHQSDTQLDQVRYNIKEQICRHHTLAVVKGGEDYETISQATFAEINHLQHMGYVTVNGVRFQIELFLSSDMKVGIY